MEKNRETSFRFLSIEAPEVIGEVGTLFWHILRCDELPAGVDYYVVDTAAEYGTMQAAHWLNLVLGLPDTEVTDLTISTIQRMPVRDVITSLELYRRRRARVSPRWIINHSIFTNRYNRARRRAFSLFAELATT